MNTVITTSRSTDSVDRNHQADELITQNARINRHNDGAERINLFRRDMLDSAPDIEHYNNYNKSGILCNSPKSIQTADTSELTDAEDSVVVGVAKTSSAMADEPLSELDK